MVQFAKRMDYMKPMADIVKNLFHTGNVPGVIPFSIGSPASEILPVDAVREIANDVLTWDKRGVEALQYSSNIGLYDLRDIIAKELLAPKGITASPDQIAIVCGGLETMNLICQVFINPGDVILVEDPTFVHCVEIFDMFEAKCIPVPMDADGMDVDAAEELIRQYHPKMIYTVPTFQNPTGRTLCKERRQKLAALGSQYDVLILEDDPYRDLRYDGEDLPLITSFDTTGHTVLGGSFSKIFSPGARLGYVYGTPEIIDKVVDAKSATNSHTSVLAQVLCAEFFKRGYFPAHLERVRQTYRERRDTMMEAIDTYFPQGTTYTRPAGGLFLWPEVPGTIDTTALLPEAIDHGVAYVAGAGFFVHGQGKGRNCMRLSYGNVTPDQIRKGIQILGEVLRKHL